MLEFIEGKISDITPSYIVISTNGIGFQVYTPNPYSCLLYTSDAADDDGRV